MTRGVARLGDTVSGRCSGPGHIANLSTTGKITTASGNIQANTRPVARIGDSVQLDCLPSHKAKINTSSPDVTTNRPTARLGDQVVGDGIVFEGKITTASPDVYAN